MITPFVSWAAFGLSVVSIAWQAWSWKRTGPLVRVAATWGRQKRSAHVAARNGGRSSSQVVDVMLLAPNGQAISYRRDLHGFATRPPALPKTLEPGSEETWAWSISTLDKHAEANGCTPEDLRAWVQLGSGKKVKARRKGFT